MWQCDIFLALLRADSCGAVDLMSCMVSFVARPDGRLARCKLERGNCVEDAPAVAGCAVPSTELLGANMAACAEELGDALSAILHERKLAGTVELSPRLQLAAAGLSLSLDRWAPTIGYIGVLACVAVQTLPIGQVEVGKDAWTTSYQLSLVNSLLCPEFGEDGSSHGSVQSSVGQAALPSGKLRFSCDLPSPDTFLFEGPSREIFAAGPGTAFRRGVRMPAVPKYLWTTHVWGCARLRRAGKSGYMRVSYEPRWRDDNATGPLGSSIHHAHLPTQACVALRQVGQQPERVAHWAQLREYFHESDYSDRGRHGLLHEFGEWLARRCLRDHEATAAVLELLFVYYLSIAPLHSFLSSLMVQRPDGRNGTSSGYPNGASMEQWVVEVCVGYLRPTGVLGVPRLSDPHNHMFAECAHGAGHGARKRNELGLCAQLAQRVAQQPDLPEYGRALWMHACQTGASHQATNELRRTAKLTFPGIRRAGFGLGWVE